MCSRAKEIPMEFVEESNPSNQQTGNEKTTFYENILPYWWRIRKLKKQTISWSLITGSLMQHFKCSKFVFFPDTIPLTNRIPGLEETLGFLRISLQNREK